MVVTRNKNTNLPDFKIRGVQIKKFKEFKHLDSKITKDGRCKCEHKAELYRLKRWTICSKEILKRMLEFVRYD